MKKTDLKEKSSILFIGRGFVIIAVLIISSLSFSLGYFVGKSVHPSVESQTFSIPIKQDGTEQKIIEPEKKEAMAQQPEQTQQTQETQQTKQTQQTQETPKTRKYTVQVVAFKNAPDANALKAKLNKKGYKAYVTPSKTKRHEKLYKVMIGEFSTRKEAEVLSIKIRKSEGLQTFVTFKTEQEDLR